MSTSRRRQMIASGAAFTMVSAVALALTACGHPRPSASSSSPILATPSGASTAPSWLRRTARESAAQLSDGTAQTTITYVAPRSRFPRVVLTGSFACGGCPIPRGAAAPRAHVAAVRYDGLTHESLDFGLCGERAECMAALCGGRGCTRARVLFDAALRAFHARAANAEFGDVRGTHSCHVDVSRDHSRYVIGSCTAILRLDGAHAGVATFTQRWRREYRNGRFRHIPERMHTWRVLVSDDGWSTRVASSGDALPELAR